MIMHKYSRGFTLVELMVVVVILGFLLGIAMPNYSNYMQKTRRTDARNALLEIAAAQERHFFEHNQYTGTIADVWSHQDGSDFVSGEGYYTLTVALKSGTGTFKATATARGKQAGDVDCKTLSIDETRLKTATAGTGGDASVCW
jgi:type IV pilus assembly protein PilE